MRQHGMNMTSTMVAIGLLGTFGVVVGCSTGGSTDEVTTDEAALKAASPACESARDACKTKFESIASGLQTACTSRDACKAAFDAAKPELQAAAKACETSIKTACVLDVGGNTGGGGRGSFGGGPGSLGGATGHGSFGGGPGSLGGATGHGSLRRRARLVGRRPRLVGRCPRSRFVRRRPGARPGWGPARSRRLGRLPGRGDDLSRFSPVAPLDAAPGLYDDLDGLRRPDSDDPQRRMQDGDQRLQGRADHRCRQHA